MNAGLVRRSRPQRSRLLVLDASGCIRHSTQRGLASLLAAGDLVVANDAATLPASLGGVHLRTGAAIEVRLAGRPALSPEASEFTAVVFGGGDYRTRTEERPLPPVLRVGDQLAFATLHARVVGITGHPRLVTLQFLEPSAALWEGLARHGRPVQYAHVPQPLAIRDTWTSIAALPVAFEAPSAGFVLDWSVVGELRRRGIHFATLTHAAGLSSTGDPALDERLPFDEPYVIPSSTAQLIAHTRRNGRRIIAIGTTVVRALEDAGRRRGQIAAGAGLATGRITSGTPLQIVKAIVSGVHEPGTSHYQLLRAFHSDDRLRAMLDEAERHGYLAHEFGDAVLIERQAVDVRRDPAATSKVCAA